MKKRCAILPIVILTSLLTMGCHNNDYNLSSNPASSNNQQSESSPIITNDIVEIANNYKYDFNPKAVSIEKKDSYDYSSEELKQLQVGETRNNHYLVYVFEGEYNEGYQSNLIYSGRIYLWDDGLFAALIYETTVKGYWYNALSENGDNCLVLISNQEHFEQSIATVYTGDYYLYQMYYYVPFNWGQRNLLMRGYYYYPDVAISFLDYLYEEHIFKVGQSFYPKNIFTVIRILKDLNCIQLLFDEKDSVIWNIPDAMLNSSSQLISTGEFTITAQYKALSASLIVKVN